MSHIILIHIYQIFQISKQDTCCIKHRRQTAPSSKFNSYSWRVSLSVHTPPQTPKLLKRLTSFGSALVSSLTSTFSTASTSSFTCKHTQNHKNICFLLHARSQTFVMVKWSQLKPATDCESKIGLSMFPHQSLHAVCWTDRYINAGGGVSLWDRLLCRTTRRPCEQDYTGLHPISALLLRMDTTRAHSVHVEVCLGHLPVI